MRLRIATLAISAAITTAAGLAAVPADAQPYGYGHRDGYRGDRHDHRGYDRRDERRWRHHHRHDGYRGGYYGRHR